MPKSTDLEKTWKPGPAVTTNFNTTSNLSIPYGRYRGTISGKGAEGNAPNALTWNTNYNTAYPIANRPIATQPAATWNTNYNVAYPTGNQPLTGYNSYAYKNVYTYRVMECQGGWTNPLQSQNFTVDAWSHHSCGTDWYISPAYGWGPFYYGQPRSDGAPCQRVQAPGGRIVNLCVGGGQGTIFYTPGNPNYTTNYNTVYPIANRPAATWNTNYNTNYNTAYPIANQPAATYNVANAGAPATIFGVTFPGAPASANIGVNNPGPAVGITAISYWAVQDNTTVSVPVPAGGNVTVTFE